MVRLNLKKGVSKEVADALKARANPMLDKHGVEEASIAPGGGCFVCNGRKHPTYFVLSFKPIPEHCPVRRYVAYLDGTELKIIATLRDGFTAADLDAEEATA